MNISQLKDYPNETVFPFKGYGYLVLQVHYKGDSKNGDNLSSVNPLNAYLSDGSDTLKIKPWFTDNLFFEQLPTHFLFNYSADIAAEQYNLQMIKQCILVFMSAKNC
jgi:hypothetical protein